MTLGGSRMRKFSITPEIDWTVWMVGFQIIHAEGWHFSVFIYTGPFNLGIRW